jgi:glycosyltransferase involved in cell wall biosynthesis
MVQRKTHVLQLITNLGAGGAQRVFWAIGKMLAGTYQVTGAVFNAQGTPSETAYSLNVGAGKTPFGKLGNLALRALRLRRLARQICADVCISHMDGANWVNVLSYSRAKKILVVHGTIAYDRAMPPWLQQLRTKFIIPWLYNQAARTVAVSEGIKHELSLKYGVSNAICIPNFFEIAEIDTLANAVIPEPETRLLEQHQIIMTMGRFHEQKQQWRLFPVFTRVKTELPRTKLVILGDGELRDRLVQEGNRCGLKVYAEWDANGTFDDGCDVYLLGHRSNPFPYLRRSSLFLFPSAWEGFPMALGEAMIAKVPVVSADCRTGPREILAPGTPDPACALDVAEYTPYGVLMPTTDQPSFDEVWTRVIVTLLRDEESRQRLVEQARARMEAFDRSLIRPQWLELIEEVMGMDSTGPGARAQRHGPTR